MSEPIIKHLKQEALNKGCSVSDLVREAIGRQDIDVMQSAKVPIAQSPIRAPKRESSKPENLAAKLIPKAQEREANWVKENTVINTPEQAAQAVQPKQDFQTCKNGHPLDSRGKCFGKGCKYSK